MKQQPQVIGLEDCIPYADYSELTGRAEFIICVKMYRGYVHTVYITAMQEHREQCKLPLYEKGYRCNAFMIDTWIHKFETPTTWMQGWCEQHKCPFQRWYVPKGTAKIKFDYHFGTTLSIKFVGDDE